MKKDEQPEISIADPNQQIVIPENNDFYIHHAVETMSNYT